MAFIDHFRFILICQGLASIHCNIGKFIHITSTYKEICNVKRFCIKQTEKHYACARLYNINT